METQFKEKIESQLNEGIQDDVTMNSTTTWSPDKTKLFVATQFASSNETAFNQITKNANDIKKLDFHHVVLNDVEDVPLDWPMAGVEISNTMTKAVRVTPESYQAGQAKISSMLDGLLPEDIFRTIQSTYDNCMENGIISPGHEGTEKLRILSELYGEKALESGDMNDSLTLMKFLKTDTQGTIDEFIARLGANSRNVNQKTWTLEELQLMKVYAQIQNHKEEIAPGVMLKLQDVSTQIEDAQKAGNSPALEEIKRWIALERKKQCAALTINTNSVGMRGAFYTKEQIEAIRNKASNKRKSKKQQDTSKKGSEKERRIIYEIPAGKGFSKNAKWCPHCMKADKKEGNGFKGFNDPDIKITGRTPHRHSLCPRKTE